MVRRWLNDVWRLLNGWSWRAYRGRPTHAGQLARNADVPRWERKR